MPYVGVVVEAPMTTVYHYRVPDALADAVRPGDRVVAPFGNRRIRGVVVARSDDCPIDPARVKDLLSVSAPEERLPPPILELTRWVADYYHAGWGLALAAALPAAVRAETRQATRSFVTLLWTPGAAEDEARRRLARAPKQSSVLLWLAAHAREHGAARRLPLAQLAADAGATPAVLRPLAAAGAVEVSRHAAARDEPAGADGPDKPPPEPTPAQADALARIVAALDARGFHAFLLHGVTGSGKTEVYLRALAHTLAQGRTVLTLVPEISLTPQTVGRFRARSPAPVAVLHSGMSDGERAAEWRRIARGDARVVVGARSAVFAPLENLGLVVVDEEHERTYKQDEAPRYHGRDVAVVRARHAGAVAVLGSATPALESWANAQAGKYELLTLPGRPGAAKPPSVTVVDLKREWAEVKAPAVISRELERALKDVLARKEQAILFLNRRGFHTSGRCGACGDVLKCADCDVPLAYHRAKHLLKCHYCGRDLPPPERCPACSHAALRYLGTGVERVEEILAKILPEARTLRMDADTMSAVGAHAEALARFGRGEADVLLGTQMVTKGLDFPNVTLVGVLQADGALTLPEFRSAERTFQLVTQVIGRAGRGSRPGRAVVQAFQPEHHAIVHALAQDYTGFVEAEWPDREALGYPPCGRLARILVRGPDEKKAAEAAEAAAGALRPAEPRPGSLLGPAPCFLARVQGDFRFHLLMKARDPSELARWLRGAGLRWGEDKGVRQTVDVDPQSLL